MSFQNQKISTEHAQFFFNSLNALLMITFYLTPPH